MSSGFGGLQGRGARKQDPAIERELALSLEEIFHGCTKKMKISRRVTVNYFAVAYCVCYEQILCCFYFLMLTMTAVKQFAVGLGNSWSSSR